MNKKCLVISKEHFLWWKWEEKRYYHKWKYIDKEHRTCINCGRKEMFFGKEEVYDGIDCTTEEDWRQC